MVVLDDPLHPFKIETLYAFIASNGHGHEGLPAFRFEGQWMPLIAADEGRLKEMRVIAQKLADEGSAEIVLCKFERRVELEVITPKPKGARDVPQDDS